MVDLSLLGLYKVTALLKLTVVNEFVKKDYTKILRLLKSKNKVLNPESTISEDPRVEINKDNNKL